MWNWESIVVHGFFVFFIFGVGYMFGWGAHKNLDDHWGQYNNVEKEKMLKGRNND